jgi:mono/diheme cytochrome c family protein
MVLRKGNGRNPRVDGSARRADDRFGDDDRPLNKSYKTQTQVPTVAKHQPDQTIAAVLELLAETWPKCFSIYEARRQPLKVGVHHDILAALDGAVTAAELSRALRVYTGNKVYRSRVRPGAMCGSASTASPADGTCIGCHGADAKGSPQAPSLVSGKWLDSDGSFARIKQTIRDGVPKPKNYSVPMPPRGGAPLSDSDVDAVAAYVWAISHPHG